MSKIEYQKVWESHVLPLLYAQWNLESNVVNLKKNLGVGYRNSIMVVKKLVVETFYSKKDMERESRCGYKIFSTKRKAKKLLEKSERLSKKGLDFSTKLCNSDLSHLSYNELFELFKKVYDWSKELFGLYNTTQPQCSELVEQELIKYLEKEKASDPTQAFLDLIAPSTTSLVKQTEIDWYNILISKKQEKVADYYKKYRFFGTEEGVKPKPLNYYVKQFKKEIKISKKELNKKVCEIKKSLKQIKSNQSELIKKYRIAEKIQDMTLAVQSFSHVRLKVRLAWVSVEWACRHLFKEVGKRYKINSVDLENYTKEEIIELFKQNKKVSPSLIKDRNKFFVAYLKDSKFNFLMGKKAENYIKTNDLYKKLATTELKGHIANKGYAKGSVTVINVELDILREMSKMKKGNILIATQTKPVFIPAIKKASAIVTDEGGITSHAAIVSREFGIPCITATHYATKVFKDGDYIEVNANKGVVKKLTSGLNSASRLKRRA